MQFDKICRACLHKEDKMINMSEKDVYKKFLIFANLSAEEEIPNIPLNLCQSCEQKLNASYDFKEKCQKSHEILLSYAKKTHEVASEATAVVSNPKQPVRLQQFSHHQVLEAIKEVRRSCYKNTNCIRCSYVGNNLNTLSRHVSRMHNDLKPRWCCYCNEEFDNLTDHVATKHTVGEYTCKFCSRKFPKVSPLIEHISGHSDVKSFRCPFCKKSFNRQGYLNTHLREHMIEKPYKCIPCNKSFTRVDLMRRHSKMHESISDADTQMTAIILKELMPVHTSEALYTCRYCNKNFKTHNNLVEHECTHTYLADNSDSYSLYQSSSSSMQRMKERVADKPADKRCLMCNKTFLTDAMLNSHINTHDVSFLDI